MRAGKSDIIAILQQYLIKRFKMFLFSLPYAYLLSE
jgi:hypothetical protein